MNQATHSERTALGAASSRSDQASLKRAAEKVRGASRRDTRLDFFRGGSLVIIFMAHMLGNPLNAWIPARFGFSDAADTFVFCSGFASGLAFYGVFARHGLAIGTLRIGYRVWQVYWAFIFMTLSIVATALIVKAAIPESVLVEQFYLGYFIENFDRVIFPLLTIRYHPALADVLPMYLVLLAAIPAVVAAARVNRYLPLALSLLIYFWANIAGANLTRVNGAWEGLWYFNPLAWQIYFFAGFLISSGVLPKPPRHWALTAFALGFVLLSLPVSDVGVRYLGPWASDLRWTLLPQDHKTNLAVMRVVHFFCTAYLVGVSWRGLNEHLQSAWARPVVLMGQYALAIFITGALLSMLGTAIAGVWRGGWTMWIVLNACGVMGLYLTATIARASRRVDRRSAPLAA